MKIVGCICIFFAAAGAGLYASKELERRKKEIVSLRKSILSMEREISFQLSTLSEAFLYTGERSEEPWKEFFKDMAKKLEERERKYYGEEQGVEGMFREVRKKWEQMHPWKKEWEILEQLFRGLGQLDKEMQMGQLRLAQEELTLAEQEAGEEQKKKGQLYRSLGICMGILGVILLV